jgi:hypothetical protein
MMSCPHHNNWPKFNRWISGVEHGIAISTGMKQMGSSRKRVNFLLLSMIVSSLLWLSGCGTQPATGIAPTPSQTANPADDGAQAILDLPGMDVVPTLAEIVPTRTPIPTATPDALTNEILQIVQETGLSGKTLLWLGFAKVKLL